jgi:hypothetical protein
MKARVSIPIVLSLILATVDSGILSAQPTPIAKLIEGRGVELKREGWLNYRPTSAGTDLNRGDLLRVQKGGRGVIRCTYNSTTWTVPDDGVPWGVTNTCSPPIKSGKR